MQVERAMNQEFILPRVTELPVSYSDLYTNFRWQVPEHFNIAQACSQRWAANPATCHNTALCLYSPNAANILYSYAQLQTQANQLANVLSALGVQRGDRVALVLPQSFETAVAYIAVLQLGAVAMPLSMLFGADALQYRLHDSEAVLAICDASMLQVIQSVRGDCPLLTSVIALAAEPGKAVCSALLWDEVLAQASAEFTPVNTLAEEPALLIYTSGTTGNPKGALIPHRALIGNLSGFLASQNWFGFDGKSNASSDAIFWSPADWAWTGGLLDALLPTLYFGRQIVAYSGRFHPHTALGLMRDCGVTHTFLFPTALKSMMKACPGTPEQSVRQQFQLKLRAIMSAGEALGAAVFDYCLQQLGVTPNEMFGQTEVNYIVGNSAPSSSLSPDSATPAIGWPAKPGSMGMAYPGHRVAVLDEDGQECPAGVVGEVALHRFDIHGHPDPIFFLGYWKNPAASVAKFSGDWCRTGDLAKRDEQGYLWYQGRSDDMFKVAGYRIGPGEIENCLIRHPAVLNAAVVPKPDAERGALVKAYVVLAPELSAACANDAAATERLHSQLRQELQKQVKEQLAHYEYPKEIEFVASLPMTTTGKVQRRLLRLQEEERYADALRENKSVAPHHSSEVG